MRLKKNYWLHCKSAVLSPFCFRKECLLRESTFNCPFLTLPFVNDQNPTDATPTNLSLYPVRRHLHKRGTFVSFSKKLIHDLLIQLLRKHSTRLYSSTLTCQIIVQDHLIVQVADFSEINKRVGPNKAVQEGIFSHLCR